MKIETIVISFHQHILSHFSSSEEKKIDLNKESMMQDALKYIEDYCTKNEFELFAPMVGGSLYVYHLVQK